MCFIQLHYLLSNVEGFLLITFFYFKDIFHFVYLCHFMKPNYYFHYFIFYEHNLILKTLFIFILAVQLLCSDTFEVGYKLLNKKLLD